MQRHSESDAADAQEDAPNELHQGIDYLTLYLAAILLAFTFCQAERLGCE